MVANVAALPKTMFSSKLFIATVCDCTVTGRRGLTKLNTSQLFRCVPVLSPSGRRSPRNYSAMFSFIAAVLMCPRAGLSGASSTVTSYGNQALLTMMILSSHKIHSTVLNMLQFNFRKFFQYFQMHHFLVEITNYRKVIYLDLP